MLAKFLKVVTKVEASRFNLVRAAIGVVGVIVIVSLRIWYRRIFPGSSPLVGMAVFWIGLASLFAVLRLLTRRTHGYTLSSTAVSCGICGSCGYSLGQLAPEGDGCLKCPECGAAWKAHRVTRPHWNASERAPAYRAPWWMRWIGLVPSDRQLLGRDARGAYFRVIDKRLRVLPPRKRESIGADRRRQIKDRLSWIGLGWRWLVAIVPIGLACLMGLGVWYWAGRPASQGVDWANIIAGIVAIFFAVSAVLIVRGHGFCPGEKRGAAIAGFALCGSCRRQMARDKRKEDGCTNCTGCGAAWRVPEGSEPVACIRCDYSLSGLTADAGGRLTCPECGEVALGGPGSQSDAVV